MNLAQAHLYEPIGTLRLPPGSPDPITLKYQAYDEARRERRRLKEEEQERRLAAEDEIN
jgi:hypothetical protein